MRPNAGTTRWRRRGTMVTARSSRARSRWASGATSNTVTLAIDALR